MNTLYEILEVSENASNEVIEKAYKVLAKKYHPDVQMAANKANAEKKMKEINEAYEILSDDAKRKEYDEKLAQKRQENNSGDVSESVINTYEISQSELRYRDMQRRRYEEELRKKQAKMQEEMEKQYENEYYNYLRNLGYKIKESWTWEKNKKLLLALLIMIIVITILWFLPPTHNMMVEFYENNKIVKIIVDVVIGIVVAIFKTFKEMIKNIFSKN